MTAAATAVWMCPECGHGSADLRDERAHLDAHRQLRAFFVEWEAGAEAPAGGGSRRSRWLVRLGVVAAALVMLLVSSSVYSQINGAPDPGRAQVAPPPAPAEVAVTPPLAEVAPAPAPAAVTPAPAVAAPPPAPATPTPATAPRVSASPRATASVPAPTPPTPSPAAAPTATVPPTSPPAVAATPAPAPPAHLLSLCLPGICLNVL